MNLFSLEQDRYLRLVGIPVLGILIPYITILTTPCSTQEFFMKYPHIYAVFVVACIFECNRAILIYYRNRFPNLSDTFKRIGLQVIIQLIFSLGALFLLLYIWYKYLLGALIYMPFLYNNLYVGLSIPFIITLLYEATYFISKWKDEYDRNKLLEVENIKTQLHLLKKQLDPHFLFNSLSTLSSLIETEKSLALEFVDDFSSVYRYIITHKDKTLASLQDELNFTKRYIELLQKRFGNGLVFNPTVSPYLLKKQIPTLSLQMLVENAIKHNMFNEQYPLVIDVYKEGNYILVRNNIRKKQLTESSTKTGLENIIQRYKLLGNYDVKVQQTEHQFTVKIPLVSL